MPGKDIISMSSYSTLAADEGLLGHNDVPAEIRQVFGYPMRGVRRSLTDIEQSDGSVKAVFANGFIDNGVFLVGCDGLHSATRNVLFGEEPTTFLGLTQVRCAHFRICETGVQRDPASTCIFRQVALVLPRAMWSTTHA